MRRSNFVKYALAVGLVSGSIGKYFYDIQKNDEQRTLYFRALKEGRKIDGESWGANIGPTYSKGVYECCVSVIFRDNVSSMSHYGFNNTKQTLDSVDFSYVDRMIKDIGPGELEAVIVGGDKGYCDALNKKFADAGILIRDIFCDKTENGKDNKDSGKIIVADPETKRVYILDEDNGSILKILKK